VLLGSVCAELTAQHALSTLSKVFSLVLVDKQDYRYLSHTSHLETPSLWNCYWCLGCSSVLWVQCLKIRVLPPVQQRNHRAWEDSKE
jgi:hypothetical protein